MTSWEIGHIQRIANKDFPAQEIWMKGHDFWAFKKYKYYTIVTIGICKGEKTYDIDTQMAGIDVESLIAEKKEEGYTCGAILDS